MIETASGGSIEDLSTPFTKNGITTNWVDDNASNLIVLDDSVANNFRSDYIITGPAGNYGATGYPAVFMIATDGTAMKIASQYRSSFDDFNDMHDEVLTFEQHHAELLDQLGVTISEDENIVEDNPPAANNSDNNLTLFKSLVTAGTQKAPEFKLTDLKGNEVDLYADYLDQGIPVVLEMFATWCGHCKNFAESGILAELAEEHGGEIQVILIEASSSSSAEDLEAFIANYNLAGGDEIIIDSTTMNSAYGLQYFPTLFAIGSSGDMVNWGSVRNSFSNSEQLFDEIMEFEAYTSGNSVNDEAEVEVDNDNDDNGEEPDAQEAQDNTHPTLDDDFSFDTNSVVYKSMDVQLDYTENFKAPNWEFTDIDGNTHNLYDDYLNKGIPVIMESFATWCGYCKGYHTEHYLGDIAANYDDVAVFMIESASGGSIEDLSTPFTKNGITTNWVDDNASNIIVLDDSQAGSFRSDYIMTGTAGNYGATGYPAVFMINTDGDAMKIASQFRTGFDDFHDMHDELLDFDQHYASLMNQFNVTINEEPSDTEDNDDDTNDKPDTTNLTVFKSLVDSGTQNAPTFKLTDLDGNEVDLYADYLDQGIPVVLEMFATWCGHCKSFAQSGILAELADEHNDELQVIMIEASSSSSAEDLDTFIANYNLAGGNEVIIDSTSMNSAYGLQYFPTLFAINTEGEMINWGSVRNSFANSEDLYDEIMAFEVATTGLPQTDGTDDTGSNNTDQQNDEDRNSDSLNQFKSIVDAGTEIAPAFALADLNGDEVNLYTDFLDQGKTVVLELFATWCGHCKNFAQTGILTDLQDDYDDVQVIMVEASANSTSQDLDDFIASYFLQDEIIIESTELNFDYNLKYFPTLYAISPNGEMIDFGSVRFSFDDHNDLHDELIAYRDFSLGTSEDNENIRGDINNDGTLNIVDVVQSINLILNSEATNAQRLEADVNGDGKLDIIDVVTLINEILNVEDDGGL